MVTGTSNMVPQSSTMVPQGSTMVPASSSADDGASPRRASDNRRSNKPIMEKRRRARINNCLNELKTLILDALKKDPARHSKLEKADILEMTVKYLKTPQRQQTATDPTVMGKFRAGFNECASEVGRYPGIEAPVKRRLLQHLAICMNQVREQSQENAPVQVQILPKPAMEVEATAAAAPQQPLPQQGGIFLSSSSGNSLHLLPTRLSNGDIAFVLPTATIASPLPHLVPIPTRTSSNESASSGSSGLSGVSLEPLELLNPMALEYISPVYNNCQQKPLSLVVNKGREHEEKVWRPW